MQQTTHKMLPRQDPRVIKRQQHLMMLLTKIEREFGYSWRVTSFLRDSPSHHNGSALDVVPYFDDASRKRYSGYNGSDPVWHLRPLLLQKLQNVKIPSSFHYNVGIFVENDHLHLHLFKKPTVSSPAIIRVFPWGRLSSRYSDSASRMKMSF